MIANNDYDEETLTHNKESYVSDDEILEKMETIMKVSLIQKFNKLEKNSKDG